MCFCYCWVPFLWKTRSFTWLWRKRLRGRTLYKGQNKHEFILPPKIASDHIPQETLARELLKNHFSANFDGNFSNFVYIYIINTILNRWFHTVNMNGCKVHNIYNDIFAVEQVNVSISICNKHNRWQNKYFPKRVQVKYKINQHLTK